MTPASLRPARERVLTLVRAARRLADGSDPLGRKARENLVRSTGLSPEGIELALERCLETQPSDAELDALCHSVTEAPRAHVLLSANVFVAAHRAIALALAASREVVVRASRREPEMAALLLEAAPGAFTLRDALEPAPGDHVFAYGSDETIAALRRDLPRGVVLHAHGAGFAVAVAEAPFDPTFAARLALDIALFDQRGCLSPRALVVRGAAPEAVAAALAAELAALERRVPRGELSPDEAAAAVRYRDTLLYAGSVAPAGAGYVSFGSDLLIPPVGRNCHVVSHDDPVALLSPLRDKLTSIGVESSELERDVKNAFPNCRLARVGDIQRPPFDGPVDLRGSTWTLSDRA